jgi:hypothetical protein
MSEKIAVKAICGDDVRRFSIDPTMRFAGLQDEVKTRFNLSEDSLKLKFKDDEGGAPLLFLCVVSSIVSSIALYLLLNLSMLPTLDHYCHFRTVPRLDR